MDFNRFKNEIDAICSDSGVVRLAVFGSVARGNDRPDSDVDLLVEFKGPVGLPGLLKLERRFESAFGRRVDLGTESSLHPLIKSQVRRELKILYEDQDG